MRDYIILNGVNSNTITGLLISTLPPITKPKIRTQTEEIDGRDGDIVTKLGYSAYDKELEIGLYGDFDINEVISYFNSEGTVTFSNEPDKYYNYQILDQIDYEKLIRFKTANVKMHVQPFKYPLEETPVEITIQNVTGSGENIDLDNTAEAPLTLALKGNTSQDGTPTPDAPVEVKTVTGGQVLTICGKNLFDKDNIVSGYRLDGSGNPSSSASNEFTSGFIPVESGATYIRSYGNISAYTRTCFYDKSKSFVSKNDDSQSFTIPSNVKYIRFSEYLTRLDIMQLEKGSTVTTYEPYQGQSYEINLGKNLFDKNTMVLNATINYSSHVLDTNANARTIYIPVQPSTTYTMQKIASSRFIVGYTSDNNITMPKTLTDVVGPSTSATTHSFTTNSDTKYVFMFLSINDSETTITNLLNSIQIEKGSVATSYSAYKTPIELCKIGDYQDRIYKNGNKWYIEKNIGKVVLNGSETITNYVINISGHYRYGINISGIKKSSSATEIPSIYCTHYVGQVLGNAGSWGGHQGISIDNANERIYINDDTYYTQDTTAYKTWLSTNNVSAYYPLATPTTTEITDTELIGQLEAIKTARSYDPITHISQNTANKPFILNATAVQKGTDTATVNNEGNIYAKPTIDIEGSGIADIYLNGNQILIIDLSTINECVIDTTNLEAYNPTTNILMNRQVTGDYSNFKLNAGDNEVKISGAVTKATISKYTRWL